MRSQGDRPTTLTVADGDDLAARVARIEALLFGTERWLGVGVVADRLGVSRWTVGRWAREGRCPARLWQGHWEIDPVWVAQEAAKTDPRKD